MALVALLPWCFSAHSAEGDTLAVGTKARYKKYIPEINGTVRAKYEYQPEMNAGRFAVRNARFSLSGQVIPMVSYKAEIDLSDEGSIRMLDAYARIEPLPELKLTMGQMRVPFSIDAHRSPHQQYFANRSFIAKQVGNIRDVGLVAGYRIPSAPVVLEAGVFNGSGIVSQKEWHKSVNYSAKVQFPFLPGANVVLSSQTIKPEDVRIYMHDIGAYYEIAGFHIEGEYLFKHYADGAFANVHAVDAFVCYDLALLRVFRKISFLARYDMMTDQSDGYADKDTGRLTVDDSARQRATGGITLSLAAPFTVDLRLNYEKYFYGNGATVKSSEMDKIVLEVMVRF